MRGHAIVLLAFALLSGRLAAAQAKPSQSLAAAMGEAEALAAGGRDAEAAQAWEKAAAAANGAGSGLAQAYCLNQKAMTLIRLARYGEALGASELAISLLSRTKEVDADTRDVLLAEYQGNAATIHFRSGRSAEGAAIIERQIPVLRGWLRRHPGDAGGAKVLARLLNSLSIMLGGAPEKLSRRIELAAEALSLSAAAGQPTALLRNNLGALLREAGRPDEAEPHIRAALADPSLPQADRQVALSNLAGILQDRGKADEASRLYSEALEGGGRAVRPETRATILVNRASIAYARGDWASAEKDFRASLAVSEDILSAVDEASRVSLLAIRFYARQWLADTLVRAGKIAEAFDFAESSSARELARTLRSPAVEPKGFVSWAELRTSIPEDCAIIRVFNADWDEILVFVATSADLHAAFLPAGSRLAAFAAARASAQGSADEASPTASLRGLTIQAREKAPPPPKEDMRREAPGFDDAIRRYRTLLSEGRPATDPELSGACDALSEAVFAPLESLVEGKRRLVVIPDGILAILPWETLRSSGGAFLAERHEISYAQSATVLSSLASRAYKEPRRAAAVFAGASFKALIPERGDAVAPTRPAPSSIGEYLAAQGMTALAALPGTAQEAAAIAQALPDSELFSGAAMRESELKRLSREKRLAQFRILHFATHGIVLDEVPDFAAVALGRRPLDTEDGFLEIGEIAALELHADLVVISACETGLGYIWPGEGVAGIARSFLSAGARAVLVSLWAVSDAATADFMRDFYARLAMNGEDPVEALAFAKRAWISLRADPFVWAPFVLYGGNPLGSAD